MSVAELTNTTFGCGGSPVEELSEDVAGPVVLEDDVAPVDSPVGPDAEASVVVASCELPVLEVVEVPGAAEVEGSTSATHWPASPSPANVPYRRPDSHSASSKEQYPVGSQVPAASLARQPSSSEHV